MDESERSQLIVRGKKARDVLENEAFQEAYQGVMEGLFASFISSASEDASEREKNWAVGQALSLVKNRLESFVQQAALEETNRALDGEKR